MSARKTTKTPAASTPAKPAKPAKPANPAKATKSTQASLFDAIEPLPTDAYGLSRAPRFAASEHAAALLGLGYPHIVLPSPAPFTGTDQDLLKLFDARVIPRAALPRMWSMYHDDEDPPTLAEAVHDTLRYGGAYAVFSLEARYGSVATARAFVDRLAKYPVDEWSGDHDLENYGWSMIRMLYSTLLRVPTEVRNELRATLEEVFAKVTHDKSKDDWWRPVEALDVILHARAGVERSGNGYEGKLHLGELKFADDDPEWVAAQVIGRLKTLRPADREVFDIQLAVVGGPKVLAALKASTTKFRSEQKKAIAAQLSLVA